MEDKLLSNTECAVHSTGYLVCGNFASNFTQMVEGFHGQDIKVRATVSLEFAYRYTRANSMIYSFLSEIGGFT